MKTTSLFVCLVLLVSFSVNSNAQLVKKSGNTTIERINLQSPEGQQIYQNAKNEGSNDKVSNNSVFSTTRSETNKVFNQTQEGSNTEATVTVLPGNNSTSGNGRAPQGSRRFINTKYIITAAEMSSYIGTVTSVGWRWNVPSPPAATGPTAQSTSSTGNIRVYLKDTSAASVSVGGTFIDTNGVGYTKVIDGTITIPSGTAEINIDVPVGGPGTSSFTPTPGSACLLIFVYKTTTATLPTPLGAPNCFCTNAGGTLLTYQSQTAGGSVGTASAFRPETRFGGGLENAISMGSIWSMGKTALCVPCPDSNFVYSIVFHERAQTDTVFVSTKIKNVGGSLKYDYLDTIITTGLEGWLIGHFYPKNTDTKKMDSIISVGTVKAGDAIPGDNRATYLKLATLNQMNNVMPNNTYDGRVGLGTPGDLAVGFYTSCEIPLCAVNIKFFQLTGGSLPYKVKVWSSIGDTIPGSLLYSSGTLTSPAATGQPIPVAHYLPTPLTVGPGYFYVGVEEGAGGNLGIAYQFESPLRPFTYFIDIPSGTNDWFDLSLNSTNIFNIDVEAVTTMKLNLGYWMEGFYNGVTMVPDTVRVIAHKFAAPYNGIDTAVAVVGSNGEAEFEFCKIFNDSCYFYEVRHRNHIAIWSHNQCEKVDQCGELYDFRNNSANTLGGNVIFIGTNGEGGGYGSYAGDVDQNGCVELPDGADIDNDVYNFVTGYVPTDLNGDDFVDSSDQLLWDNNAYNFICEIAP